MENCEYDNDLVLNGEKNRVWEPFKHRPSSVRTELWILKWSVNDPIVRRAQFVEKLWAHQVAEKPRWESFDGAQDERRI
jgi:hypothetical protein